MAIIHSTTTLVLLILFTVQVIKTVNSTTIAPTSATTMQGNQSLSPTITFSKQSQSASITELYPGGVVKGRVRVSYPAGYQSSAGYNLVIFGVTEEGVKFGNIEQPTTRTVSQGIAVDSESIADGIYMLTGSSIDVSEDSKILIKVTMSAVTNSSQLIDGEKYIWHAVYFYEGLEILDTVELTANLSVLIDKGSTNLKIERLTGGTVLNPGDQISGLVTATFVQYFYGDFVLVVSTAYDDTENGVIPIFGYFTRSPNLDHGSGLSLRTAPSYSKTTCYSHRTYNREKVDLQSNDESRRQVIISFNFILLNTPDILDNMNYTIRATFEVNGNIIESGLNITTNLTTPEPVYNTSIEFPSILYVNQPEAMVISVIITGKSSQSITVLVENESDIVNCQKLFFYLESSFCGENNYVSPVSTDTSVYYDFGTLVNCQTNTDVATLDLFLGFVLESRSMNSTTMNVTVQINNKTLATTLRIQMENENAYQLQSYGSDVEAPWITWRTNLNVANKARVVEFFLGIPPYQNRSFTLVPEWTSPALDSSNLQITSVVKSYTYLSGRNIACVTRAISEGIPGRSVMLGRMVNSGYSDESIRYDEIYLKVKVKHDMCNLHADGRNPFRIFAKYSPTESLSVNSYFDFVPTPLPEEAPINVSSTVWISCSPTNNIQIFSPINCALTTRFLASYESVTIDIRLETSGVQPLVFEFVGDDVDVHTASNGLVLADSFTYTINSSKNSVMDESLSVFIGSVYLPIDPPTCHEGWTLNDLKCYKYIGDVSSNATKLCSGFDSIVTEIFSEDENIFLNQFANENISDYQGLWLGVSDTLVEGEWMWSSAKNDSAYSNWKTTKACDWTKNCAMMDVNGTWVARECEGGSPVALVCQTGAILAIDEVERSTLITNFSFIPYSSQFPHQEYIINATVNRNTHKETTSTEVFVIRPAAGRPELGLIYTFDSSENYTLGSIINIDFTLRHTIQSMATASNIYIMFYLPKLFDYLDSNSSETVIKTNYGVQISVTNFHLGIDPIRFKIRFVVTTDISIFREKLTCKGTMFVSTVYNQTYNEGSDYAQDHLFEIKQLITIEVSSSNYSLIERCTSPIPLGMANRNIKDCQISSSETPDEQAPAYNARLNMPNTAWKIYRQHDFGVHDSWLAIDLLRNATITSIATQGGRRVGTGNDFVGSIGSFQLLYGIKKDIYRIANPRIQTDPNHRSYFEHGLIDPNRVKHHDVLPAFDARYVIIKLERYCLQHIASIRVELFGCYQGVSDADCDIESAIMSEIPSRGFMVVDGQLFICNSLQTQLEYDASTGTGLYYFSTRFKSYCLHRGSDSDIWTRVSTDVDMLLGFDSHSYYIYGAKNAHNQWITLRSVDRGRSWQTITPWKYFNIKSSATFVPITSVPASSTEDYNWLNPSYILNNYISDDIGASYDGIYKNMDGTWQKIFEWDQCCLQSTNQNITQLCD